MAVAWAAAAAPGCAALVLPAGADEDSFAAVAERAGIGVVSAAPADAARAAFERHGGPLLVAAAETPLLSPAHARAALADLATGADASFGPGFEGGWYLAALRRPHAGFLDLLQDPVAGPDAMGRALAVATAGGLEVGLLRMERLLHTVRDAAALRVDPLVPAPLRHALAELPPFE